MVFIVAEKQGPHGLLLIVTDAEILGKVFEEGKRQLDLSKSFYQGTKKSEKEVREMMKKVQILHLTGEKAIALGLELDLVNKERILRVKKVPHAEVVME